MAQDATGAPLSRQILDQLGRGHKREEVEARLLEQGYEAYFVKQILDETIKLRSSRARTQALVLILAGAGLCLASCIITLGASLSQGSFSMVLYGLTSLGILLVFAGLAKIF